MTTALASGLATCEICCKLVPVGIPTCPRCGAAVHPRRHRSLQLTLAMLVTASLLYIPANVLPIMYTEQFGASEASTILGGVMLLIRMDSVPIAAVIFVASVMVPIGKLLALYYLVWSVQRHSALSPRQRGALYRVTELIGKWSMVDVFVVAILVALVQLGGVLVIRPGYAALSFAGVVIITMMAAEYFDARLIWDGLEDEDDAS